MPQNTSRMQQTHPNPASVFDQAALAGYIGACPGEREHLMHLVHCIRFNLTCADVCGITGRVLSRLTQPDLNVVRAGLQACGTRGR